MGVIALCVCCCVSAPLRADWTEKESPAFTLDTTVPEPLGTVMLAAMAVGGALRRTRG
jgi:hypothetical protein